MFTTKKISLVLVSLLAIFSFATVTLAQSNSLVGKLEPVNCTAPGLYKFQSVQVSVGPEKQSYAAGDAITFTGDIVNQNSYPVVDGNVFVRISKVNPNYMSDGHNTVAELTALSSVAVDADTSLPVKFTWAAPKDLGAGDYRADYFFSVGNKFNLGGLPFTNEIIVGFANFKITNTVNTQFVLDRMNTKVNGEKYNHIGNWPIINKGEKIEITQPVKNLTNKEIKVDVTYNLYFWDSLNAADKLDTKTETVTVPANSSKDLTYIIPKSEQSVYYLNIKATTGDASSIVNIRTTSDIVKARINFPAITSFPLIKGDSANLFSCFHTIYGATNGKLALTLTDSSGNNVARGEYSGAIGSQMSAASMNFTADKDYTLLNLKAELFDDQGKVVDSYQTKYDCSILGSEKCLAVLGKNISNNSLFYPLILILISLAGLFIVTKYIKGSVFKKIFIIIFVILLILSLISLIWVIMSGVNNARAAVTPPADDKTKTQTISVAYDFGLPCPTCKYDQTVSVGDVSRTSSVTLTGSTSLNISNSISFNVAEECAVSLGGAAWDTPYCNDQLKITSTYYDDNYEQSITNDAYFIWTKPTFTKTLTSSNPAVLSCTGMSCTAVGGGTAIVTVNIPSGTSNLKACVGILSKEFSCTNWLADGDTSLGDVVRNTRYVGLREGTDYGTVTSLVLPAFYPTWTFTVASPIIAPSCGTAATTYASASTTYTGAFCAVGTLGPITPAFPAPGATVSWNCAGDTTISCSAYRNAVGGTASCFDGIRNQDETGIDTGGVCGGGGGGGGNNILIPNPTWPTSTPPTIFDDTGALDCTSLSMVNPPTAPVNVNVNTTWTATDDASTTADYVRTWQITEGTGITTSTSTRNLDKFFTTIGVKTVKFQVARKSTNKFGRSCTATTSVVLSGGSVREI